MSERAHNAYPSQVSDEGISVRCDVCGLIGEPFESFEDAWFFAQVHRGRFA